MTANLSIQRRIDSIYRTESRRIFATLVRLLGDFDLAEDALHEAFVAAARQWPEEGLPGNPRAWLVSAGRFKGIDVIRRQSRLQLTGDSLSSEEEEAYLPDEDDEIEDDSLRLIFTCCHPALAPPVQVALTLREICGLTTEAIASAFLVQPTTMAQRLVRGKAKIRDARIPYRVPTPADMPERLDSVLSVIYLVFNEGYHASSGHALTRPDLSQEAIRLGRLLLELLPDPEVMGLLALMLIQESRRAARLCANGEVVLLENQDRSRWDRQLIEEGKALLENSLLSRRFGAFTLEAAIAAVHADAPTMEDTDWHQIAALYDLLLRVSPSPVVELNRAVAVAMRDGPQAGAELVESLLARGELTDYYLAHAALADFYRRLDRREQALAAYRKALDLAQQETDRRFLQSRIAELG